MTMAIATATRAALSRSPPSPAMVRDSACGWSARTTRAPESMPLRKTGVATTVTPSGSRSTVRSPWSAAVTSSGWLSTSCRANPRERLEVRSVRLRPYTQAENPGSAIESKCCWDWPAGCLPIRSARLTARPTVMSAARWLAAESLEPVSSR